MKKHHPPSPFHPFTTAQSPPQGRKENAPKPPKNSPKTPLNHPHVTFRPIKPYHPPFACNTNVASMLHYIRFVFFRPTSFYTHNPLSINANHDFTASSCYVRFVLCPVCVPLWSESKQNKVHERYCNFDKHGNWTKHYFITARGKVFWSKRKLVYWR